jgi:adenosylcobyric acid synthase
VLGTNLHGVLEEDGFRATFLGAVSERRGRRFVSAGVSFTGARQAQVDRLADLVESHVDMAVLEKLIAEGAP